MTGDWRIKLADFGLSRFNTDSHSETMYKMKSTYSYCAPEVFHGGPFSVRSDIFACGIVFFEVIGRAINGTYTRPYPGLDGFQILLQTATRGRRPEMIQGCPTSLWELLTQTWQPEPEARLTAEQIFESLQNIEKEYLDQKETWDTLCK